MHVKSLQHSSPLILIRPAPDIMKKRTRPLTKKASNNYEHVQGISPIMMRKRSQRYAHATTIVPEWPTGLGPTRGKTRIQGQSQIAKNPVSSNCDSHPKEYLDMRGQHFFLKMCNGFIEFCLPCLPHIHN